MVRMRSAVRICPAAPLKTAWIFGSGRFFLCLVNFLGGFGKAQRINQDCSKAQTAPDGGSLRPALFVLKYERASSLCRSSKGSSLKSVFKIPFYSFSISAIYSESFLFHALFAAAIFCSESGFECILFCDLILN